MQLASLESVVFRMDLLARAEALGIPVINPAKAIEAAVDKYLTTARLAAAGLRVPRTRGQPDDRRRASRFRGPGGRCRAQTVVWRRRAGHRPAD